ncbi:MAG: hypothetical protein HY566_03720 [Candidatus Kerfeldbacteria bacterium]|nr:hypothetical protein [Candidatus Kerfeldbacteria bacterium]
MIENLIAIGWVIGFVASIASAGIYHEHRSRWAKRAFVVSFLIFAVSVAANCNQQRQRTQENKKNAATAETEKKIQQLAGDWEIVMVEFFGKPAPVKAGGRFRFRKDGKFAYAFVLDGNETQRHTGKISDDHGSFRLEYDGFPHHERWEYSIGGDLLGVKINGTLIGQDVEEHFVLSKRTSEMDFKNALLLMRRMP